MKPRKLLLIAYEYPPLGGGTGRAVLNTSRALQAMGHEVAILTSKFKDQPAQEVSEGISIFRIPVLRRHLNYANALEVLSFAVSGIFAAREILKKFHPELVLAYSTIPSGIVAREMLRGAKIPYLTLLRGQDVPGHPETQRWMHALAAPVTANVWRRSARIIANSEGLAELARQFAPDLKIEVVPNGVNLDVYRMAQPPSAVEGSDSSITGEGAGATSSERRVFRLVYTGRLVRQKRLRELIQALPLILRETSAKIELCIAGFGPERSILEKLAAELGVAPHIRFLGRIEESEVVRLLQSADVFVNLSRGEGMPNAVLEAMACGTAVVLSDIKPHRELISDGEGGILCDGGNPAGIAQAILKLIASPESRRELGGKGRKRVEEEFSWSAATGKLTDLF